jgi:hypothetical protein
MKPYDEFETFRALAKRPPAPRRYEALDDLHRTLYGTLHPAAERIGAEDAEFERDRELEGGEGGSWIEKNAALTAAIALVGAVAVFAMIRKKSPVVPLQGPPDAPQPQPATISSPV